MQAAGNRERSLCFYAQTTTRPDVKIRPRSVDRYHAHELSHSGKPWHRVERLEHIVNWFDKYLQDKPMPQYDTGPAE
jgi:hypothetical protein